MPVASEVVPNNAMGVMPGGSMQYLITVRPLTELNGIPGYCQVCWHSFLGKVTDFLTQYVFSQSGWQSQLMRLLQRAEAGCMRISVWDTASTPKSGWLAGKLMSEGEWKIPKKKGKDKTIHTIPMVFHHQPGNHISCHHCNDIILSPDNSVSWILVTERACLFFDDKCKCENPKFAAF